MKAVSADRNIDIVRTSLDAMPRSRELGATALETLRSNGFTEVMSGVAFMVAIRHAVEGIAKWAKDAELSDEVLAFASATDEELIELQKSARFSRVQVMMWAGEMQGQIWKARSTHPN